MEMTDDFLDSYKEANCIVTDCLDDVGHLFSDIDTSGCKLIHINIRSYTKNIDSFMVLLEGIAIDFDVIVLTETWLDEYRTLTAIQDYDIFVTTNTWNRNDGVVVYIKTGLLAMSKQITLGEAHGLELNFSTNGQTFSLLAVYKSPSMDSEYFITALTNYYTQMTKATTYLLVGDTNIDIHSDVNNTEKDMFLNCLYGSGFVAYIDKPTRVTDHSQTCIDHIFIKHTNYRDVTAAILQTDITDHYVVLAKIKYADKKRHNTEKNDISTTYIDTELLNEWIQGQTWDLVLAQRDVNKCCEIFINTMESLKSKAVRIKKLNTRYRKIKPWITKELIKGIRERDKLSKSCKRQPFNNQLKIQYRNLRNNISKNIKKAKIMYYKERFLGSMGDPKAFWNTLNEFSNMKKQKRAFPINRFLCGTNACDSEIEKLANKFNKFFSLVGKDLAMNLPHTAGPRMVDDAEHRVEHVLRLEPVSESLVEKCVREMRGGSAPGVDGILASTIKTNVRNILLPLTHLVNLSITSGVFPDQLKTAKVIPLHKANDQTKLTNYRPISLMSVLSKVLEKVIKWQLQNYLQSNDILTECQYGFRKGKNSSDALFSLNKTIMESVNDNKKCLLLFIDLAKAFDSIDRDILFSKLESIGIRGIALKWFKSYLSNRKQIVSICNRNSGSCNVEYGVVQGSTLGPILFLIYINNLDKLNLRGKLFLFADDTAVFFEGNDWNEVYRIAARDVTFMKKWFDQNILSMNISKTKCMPVSLRAGGAPAVDLQLKVHSCSCSDGRICDCPVIERVNSYKYLGVIFDSKLRWDKQVTELKNKLRKMIFVAHQLGQVLTQPEFKMVYCAFVQSVLQYGIIAWGGAFKTVIEPVTVVQKAIIKAGFKKRRRYSTVLVFKESGILSVRQLFIKTLLLYAYANKDLILTPLTHYYLTRNALNYGLQIPRAVKAVNFTNAYFLANILYRNIPSQIRTREVSVKVFSRLITDWLLETGSEHAEALLTSLYT